MEEELDYYTTLNLLQEVKKRLNNEDQYFQNENLNSNIRLALNEVIEIFNRRTKQLTAFEEKRLIALKHYQKKEENSPVKNEVEIDVLRNLLRLIVKARKEPVDGNISHFAPSFKIVQFSLGYLFNYKDEKNKNEVVSDIKKRLKRLTYWED